jgi:DnaK suppressor protein
MDETACEAFVQTLHRQRAEVLKEVAETELRLIAGDRDTEPEVRAQQERLARLLARLDDRQLHVFQEIEAARQCVAEATYGTCDDCGQAIAIARLRALPATRVCAECASRQEAMSALASEEAMPRTGRIHADMRLTTDRELQKS